MPVLNVLIIGDKNSKSLSQIINSKYLNKLYTNFETEYSIEISFNTFRGLAAKCKALKIDIVFVESEKLIMQGIIDVLRNHYINCIGLTTYWTNLILSKKFARNMCQKYHIQVPQMFTYPKEFPLIVNSDNGAKVANSVSEIINIRQEIFNNSPEIAKTVFLEEYITGKKTVLTSLFDGKNLVTLQEDTIPEKFITDYNTKLETMFVQKNAGFIGYINSEIIFSNKHIINTGFNLNFPTIKTDLLFVFNLAIYQKLYELPLIKSV